MNNCRTKFTTQQSAQFSILNQSQCNEIFEAALRILERTGCIVKNAKAVEILKKAGARVDGEHVWIKPYMVERALSTAPKEVNVYDTNGNIRMELSAKNGKSHFLPGITNQHIIDRHTNVKRPTVYKDAYETGMVCEALPNFDAVAGLCFLESECDPLVADIYETRALLETTNKPHSFWNANRYNLEAQIEMFSVICGGRDKFLQRPTVVCQAAPSSPLSHEDEVLERTMLQWELGLPVMYGPTTMMGATTPSTIAGSYVVALADSFVGLILSQEINPGCPFLSSTATVPFDMSVMTPSLTGPEASPQPGTQIFSATLTFLILYY